MAARERDLVGEFVRDVVRDRVERRRNWEDSERPATASGPVDAEVLLSGDVRLAIATLSEERD